MTEKAFQKILLEAVDSAFSSLGDSGKQSIYSHLRTEFKMPRDEIPSRLRDFENGLETIFGAGSRFLEVLIMKELYERIGSKGKIGKWDETKEFNFADYIEAAEQNFSSHRKRK